ncbi:RNA-binding protein 41 [Coregonus clupeaformis]|uniref:RNA-binding protein 41 n=1 Tax=Coregonus clupeaformis TaxID=59861 RepID=UPI001BE01EEC|nr:RNA-binding protein 41 [Coregonus clupeaformis]
MRRMTCHMCEEQETEGQRPIHSLLLQQLDTDVNIDRCVVKRKCFAPAALYKPLGIGCLGSQGVCAPGEWQQRLQVIQDKMAARAELMSNPQRFSASRPLSRREMEIEKALFHGNDRLGFLTALYHQGGRMLYNAKCLVVRTATSIDQEVRKPEGVRTKISFGGGIKYDFLDTETPQRALEIVNGYWLLGKSLVIEFGRERRVENKPKREEEKRRM